MGETLLAIGDGFPSREGEPQWFLLLRDHRSMFDPKNQHDSPAAWAHILHRQELALAGKIDICEITTPIVGDDCSYIERGGVRRSTACEALDALPFPSVSEEAFDFLASKFSVHYLVPVADPKSAGTSWPTIIVPSDEHQAYFCDTEEEQDRVLEILLAWRQCVDEYASTTRCEPLGWFGGIWVPHPDDPDQMSMRWPWLHRPYDLKSRPGDSQLFELFKVSVDRR